MNFQTKDICRNIGVGAIGLGILFPLFFQLDGGIYRELVRETDSHGVLTKLPLPMSTMTCLVALLFLAGSLGRARAALGMLAGTIAVSLMSLWLGSNGVTPPDRKLMMILQVILPLAGLLLGQMVNDKGKVIARAFLVVLIVVVPWQLVATKMQTLDIKYQTAYILTHYMYLFTIYSHQQYVTLIFVCAFAYALTSLWDNHKFLLCIMMLLMAAYVARSAQFLTIFAYGALMVVFLVSKLWVYRANVKWLLMSLTLTFAMSLGGMAVLWKIDGPGISEIFLGKFAEVAEGKIPANVLERVVDWRNFGNGILESNQTLLVGHPEPLPREVRTSPHNWYIDIAYNFGLVGLLPILILMGFTINLGWKQRARLSAETWWLVAIVSYLVVVDSNFKVTLRQPYPGIFAYFMWGLLLARLQALAADKRHLV